MTATDTPTGGREANAAAGARSRTRLFVAGPLAAGAALALAPAQVHFLADVLRVQPGEAFLAFNERDGEWRIEVAGVGRRRIEAVIGPRVRAPRAEPGPVLAFAPLKKDAMDVVTAAATELGVSALWPVITRRTNAARVNVERLRAQVIEAAEQCGRLTIPAVEPPRPLASLLDTAPQALLILDERRDGLPIADAMRDLGEKGLPAPQVLIGPEGGFADGELDPLLRLPSAVAVSLGPRILRAETAAIAALACWQAIAGDARLAVPAAG